MSMQLALRSALSGLAAAQQQAATLSHNVANATTPGFVKKAPVLTADTSAGKGQGVRVAGIDRAVDELLIRDARFETSRFTAEETRASALADYAAAIGQPHEERSFAYALQQFELSLGRLHELPDDEAARAAVVDGAEALVRRLTETAQVAADVQTDARQRLADSVDEVNRTLALVSDLNAAIATRQATGGDTGDLMDQRDLLLDRVSEEIGIRTHTRDNGMVVVMTRNGQTLLDGILPAGGEPLQIVGTDLVAGGTVLSADPARDIQSGRIMGYVTVAGTDVPRILEQLDALAAGLVGAFQDAEADPTQPGLFTDAGAAFTTATGLASRIAVNGVLATEPWRVQSGIQAAAPLPEGEQTQIARFLDSLGAPRAFAAPDLPSSATLGAFAEAAVTAQQGYRTTSESEMGLRKIAADTLTNARINRDGVNVDAEMQRLLLVEQSYGASAQVLQAAGRMIDTLLQIAN